MANGAYPRTLEAVVRQDLALYPVVAVMGARQVGKSTLCRKIADDLGFTHCTLDDRDLLEIALETPEALLADLGSRALIDEAQRAPGLFLAIKAVVDREQRPGVYLLTGSNQPKISGGVGDSLLGRAAYRTLRPLILSELRLDDLHPGWSFLFGESEPAVLAELQTRAESSGDLDWREIVRSGGFPRALAAPRDQRARVLNDYVEVFASRDIREVVGVESAERFESFIRIVGAWTGQILNASAISRDLGTPVNTIRRWIDALGRSYLIEIIEPYSRNASQRVIKAPKVFFVDPALALAASRDVEPTGFYLETLVCNDMAVWREEKPGRAIYHWRTSGGNEVDFVLQENANVLPVEVKAASRVDNNDARHLRKFRDAHGSLRALLLSCDPRIRPLSGGVIAAPWWAVV